MINKEWLDRIIVGSLCAMIFTLPFSKSMLEIFFTIALVSWAIKRFMEYCSAIPRISFVRAFTPVSTELNSPIAVFILTGFLSTVCSVSFSLSLQGFFFKLFEWIMIYFIVAETVNTKEKVNLILTVMLAAAFLISADGIFQVITGTDFLRNFSTQGCRITASFNSPNGAGAWLMVMFLLTFSLAYFSKNSKNPVLWVLVCLLIFCLALTYSRSAWIATTLSMILLGLFRDKKIVVIALIALLIVPFIASEYGKDRMKASVADDVRVILWQEAIDIAEDFPFLGTGLNTYAAIAPSYKLTKDSGCYPHNSYLQMLAESGILGLVSFLLILTMLFKVTMAKIKSVSDKFYEAVLVGLLAGLFGFLAHSFFDVNFYSLQLGNFMWFIMGLIIAAQKIALQKNLP